MESSMNTLQHLYRGLHQRLCGVFSIPRAMRMGRLFLPGTPYPYRAPISRWFPQGEAPRG